MRRYGNLFENIISFENLLKAAKKAFRGKKDKARVARFYFDMEKELLCLQEELLNKTYEPRPLRKFQIREPKPREIGASDFRDRVVHHAICNTIEPILERGSIHHSYACRIGKGTHRAVMQAQIFSRKHSYFLKCDIRKYFASIDHEILNKMLARKFKDADLMWLLNTIIDSAESENTGKGVPIGSLTSQHFANLYLDKLDHCIKDCLRVKSYLRYMDDFILFGNEKAELHLLHSTIRAFLRDELTLELKEKATIIAPVQEGDPFLGFWIFPNLIRLKHENKKRALNTLKSRNRAFKSGKTNEEKYSQSLMSITEYLKIGNTYNLRKDIFSKMFFL
ncbi:Reverse transcriptase (RNA-dependent DNA polymerase) [uncultured archaeon]|nr:Reverse transcriptase (RNA-dependent DNA polymerase) [uncultured archaeon]